MDQNAIVGTDERPPSPFRIPVTALLMLVVPPLGLLAWIALSGSQRSAYLRSGWVRWGLGIGIGGAVPLLVVGLADPQSNPIGLGLLFLACGGLGTILLAVGVMIVARR